MSRRADAVLFGFDFQVNAAILLMLENIKDLQSLKLEGNYEDIELRLSDNKYILAQAKAVVNSSSDFSNVRKNLKKSLESLSEGDNKANAEKLIFITNSPNPFKDDESRSAFWGPTHRSFAELPSSAQKIVSEYLSKIDKPLDTDKFSVQVFPFETDNYKERHKYILQEINIFIENLKISSTGLGKRLMEIWHYDIFNNGSKKNADIVLNKKDIIWPIMVIVTDAEKYDDEFIESFDDSLYDEIIHQYKELIDNHCERIEFFTRVLTDFNNYKSKKGTTGKTIDFIECTWKDYVGEFTVDDMDAEIREGLIKIILYTIIRRRLSINNIKQGVNL